MAKINVSKVCVVVRDNGPDKVILEIDAPLTFPFFGYIPTATVETAAGRGVDWVKETFGAELDVEVIQIPSSKL